MTENKSSNVDNSVSSIRPTLGEIQILDPLETLKQHVQQSFDKQNS